MLPPELARIDFTKHTPTQEELVRIVQINFHAGQTLTDREVMDVLSNATGLDYHYPPDQSLPIEIEMAMDNVMQQAFPGTTRPYVHGQESRYIIPQGS